MNLCRALLAAPALLAVSQGCALEPGVAFGDVDGTLSVEFEDRGRINEEGWLQPVGSYEVRLDALEIQVSGIRLIDTTGKAGASEAFDPTSPPPGWLCHGDHCHTPDGDLVSFEEAAIILGGGPAGPRTLLTFPVDDVLEPLSDEGSRPLVDCSPSCLVGKSLANMLAVDLERVLLEGVARDRMPDNRLEEETVPLFIDVAACDSSIVSHIDEPIIFDRGHPPLVNLDLILLVHPSILDGLPLDALQDNEEIRVTLDPADRLVPEAAVLFLENMEASRIEANVIRRER